MTMPPSGAPPGRSGAYPPDPRYAAPSAPRPGSASLGPPASTVPPRRPELLYQPVYRPPGQEPLPPRRRQPRSSPIIAPLLALLGLVLVGGATLWAASFLGVSLTDGAAAEATPTPRAAVAAEASGAPDVMPGASPEASITPEIVVADATEPPDIVEPPPDQRAEVKGTILFSRAGDIWAASGQELRRLTNVDSTKADSGPTWSPDGRQIYFIRTTKRPTANSRPGGLYTLYTTDLWRMKADGSDRKRVYDSLIRNAAGTWFSHVLQPDVNPDGRSVAVVSDGPDGSGPVELHLFNPRSGRMSKVAAPAEGDLGHNDPDFSPDGRKLAFTYNSAKGSEGVPRVGILNCKTPSNCTLGSTRLLRPGFGHPSWSPDGAWLAVEATRGTGRDIVIIDPRKGDVRVVLTNDGDSFAPVISPNGDQIAYLHRDGIDIDVRVMTLDIAPDGKITLREDRAVTDDGIIDAESPPSWFMPADEITAAGSPAPDASATASESPAAEPDGEAIPAPPG